MEFMNPEEEHRLIVEYNKRFPYKVELHVHLDGAVRPETVLAIARERGLQDTLPHQTVHELNRDVVVTEPCSLERVLQSFHIYMPLIRDRDLLKTLPHQTVDELNRDVVLVEPSSLERLLLSFSYFMPIISGCEKAVSRVAYELCEDCARHRIKYMEVRYCPQLFCNSEEDPEYAPERGNFTPRDVVVAVNSALSRGMKEFGVTVKTILCCMTHKPHWAQEILDLCKEFKNDGVVGIDVAGMEFEPGTHHEECNIKKIFREAARCGIHRTVHAGEVGTAKAVQEAMDDMLAERIGHGYHSIDDPAVYKRVIDEQVHLETCPISSILTKACDKDEQKHPLKIFVKDGVNYSINTDDPVVLGNTLTDDYKFANDMGLTDKEIIRGIFNAARSCFASEDEKTRMLKELKEAYGEEY